MCENFGAVEPLPIKSIVREGVGIVPTYFGREEIVYAAAFHNLRNCGTVAECIRQPKTVGGVIKMLARKALAPEELPDHGFARGNIAVALHPNAAVWLVATLCNKRFDALKKLWIMGQYHIPMASGALNKLILRVLLHEAYLVGKSARTLFDGLVNVPKPCGIHVRMADDCGKRGTFGIFYFKHFFHMRVCLPNGIKKGLRIRIFKRIVQHLMHLIQGVNGLGAAEAVRRQDFN